MRNRLLASLIVCVAFLTQLGASLWGAAAARDGLVGCHKQIVRIDAGGPSDRSNAPSGAPAQHDHASCSLCQLGFTAIGGEAPVLPTRSVAIEWRAVPYAAQAPPPVSIFNRSAPPRAPPSLI